MHVRELFDLSDRNAIVTGGGTGLGRQMAEALAEAGAGVALCARRIDRCEAVAAELRDNGARAIALSLDVRDHDTISGAVSEAIARLGGVDILVNNAGTSWRSAPEEMPIDGWQKVIDVNLTGTFLLTQAVGRYLIHRGTGGRIVNVASVAAFRGADSELMDAVAYNASKGGVVALTRDLAVKWAKHGITVNVIAPGWFPSDLTSDVLGDVGDQLLTRIPMRRFGGPDDIKGAVVYLSSRAADFVTGITLAVDGGQLAS